MKLTKQDYMRLSKERLAELLGELQEVTITTPDPSPMPYNPPSLPYNPYPYPWWNPPLVTYTTTDKTEEQK